MKFRNFFTLKPLEPLPGPGVPNDRIASGSNLLVSPCSEIESLSTEEICCGYLSDMSESELPTPDDEWSDLESDDTPEPRHDTRTPASESHPNSSTNVIPPPQRKRQKLDVPAREQKKKRQEAHLQDLKQSLTDIERLIASKQTAFSAGHNGLQAYRTRSIQTCLHMVVNNNRRLIDASERAAESQGFAEKWGGRMVRQWVMSWIKSRELPKSQRGCHAKVFSLLDDPMIATELRSYLRTNKWSMNPQKLSAFTKNKLLPDEAKKYLHHIVQKEMPAGLKKYMEVELFPRIHLKVGKGVSLRTACRWLHKEGFQYTAYKKGLYYDGHEREDVIAYRQNIFLPKMKEYSSRLVRFDRDDAGNLTEAKMLLGPDERKLVLVAHDEMTAQANDGKTMSWVWRGEQPLKKKGVGRGIHQSDVICSTVGWLKDASQTLEYGKNYEGYWTGELFVKQVCLEVH